MRHLILTIAMLLAGCSIESRPIKPHIPVVVSKDYCIIECRKFEFQNFHGKGQSWGTNSSSMNGLAENNIFKLVTKTCEDFFKDRTCCEGGIASNDIDTIYGYDYGPCK